MSSKTLLLRAISKEEPNGCTIQDSTTGLDTHCIMSYHQTILWSRVKIHSVIQSDVPSGLVRRYILPCHLRYNHRPSRKKKHIVIPPKTLPQVIVREIYLEMRSISAFLK